HPRQSCRHRRRNSDPVSAVLRIHPDRMPRQPTSARLRLTPRIAILTPVCLAAVLAGRSVRAQVGSGGAAPPPAGLTAAPAAPDATEPTTSPSLSVHPDAPYPAQ